jgi:hypothetical protein
LFVENELINHEKTISIALYLEIQHTKKRKEREEKRRKEGKKEKRKRKKKGKKGKKENEKKKKKNILSGGGRDGERIEGGNSSLHDL